MKKLATHAAQQLIVLPLMYRLLRLTLDAAGFETGAFTRGLMRDEHMMPVHGHSHAR